MNEEPPKRISLLSVGPGLEQIIRAYLEEQVILKASDFQVPWDPLTDGRLLLPVSVPVRTQAAAPLLYQQTLHILRQYGAGPGSLFADPPAPPADDLAPGMPVAYVHSMRARQRRAVWRGTVAGRLCARCGDSLLGDLVEVARPGLPRETVHVGCLEEDDQVQPRPDRSSASGQ